MTNFNLDDYVTIPYDRRIYKIVALDVKPITLYNKSVYHAIKPVVDCAGSPLISSYPLSISFASSIFALSSF